MSHDCHTYKAGNCPHGQEERAKSIDTKLGAIEEHMRVTNEYIAQFNKTLYVGNGTPPVTVRLKAVEDAVKQIISDMKATGSWKRWAITTGIALASIAVSAWAAVRH